MEQVPVDARAGATAPEGAAPDRSPAGNAPTAALLTAVRAAAGWAPDQWAGPERHQVLAELDRAIATLEMVRGRVLVAEQEAQTWRGAGDPSVTAWRARTGRTGKRAASAQVRQAEGLAATPQVADAVTTGEISSQHASVVARLVSSGSTAQRAMVTSDEGQRRLVEMARRLDADTFATASARLAAEVDPPSLQQGHDAQRAARFLHLVTTTDGTLVKGRLDNMAGHRLRLALEAATPRPAADDDRDPAQRAADALDTIAKSVLADVTTRPGGHVPAQVMMILTAQEWAAARAERTRQRELAATGDCDGASAGTRVARGAGAGAVTGASAGADGGVGAVPGALEDGTPVPGSELAQVLCEAAVTRLVVDAESKPLDVGRAERVFTGPRRRAVVARDRHCAWPGCHMNARWCEVHHLDWWDRDEGRTDVARGALLCSFHHHEVHRRDLQLHVAGPAPAGDVAAVAYRVTDRTGRVAHPATSSRQPRERPPEAPTRPGRPPGVGSQPEQRTRERGRPPSGELGAPPSDRPVERGSESVVGGSVARGEEPVIERPLEHGGEPVVGGSVDRAHAPGQDELDLTLDDREDSDRQSPHRASRRPMVA